jgi:hypothetical protein
MSVSTPHTTSAHAASVSFSKAQPQPPQLAYAALKAALERLEAAVTACVARNAVQHHARTHALEAEVLHWQQLLTTAKADNTALRALLRDAAGQLAESSEALRHVLATLPSEQGVLQRVRTGEP